MNWEWIWKVVFIVVTSLFALMSVLVTILGALDVKRLLQRLKDANDED
ncbi:MAG: hypothetical protein R3C59_24230 [Planctomycetaceae bacterium]